MPASSRREAERRQRQRARPSGLSQERESECECVGVRESTCSHTCVCLWEEEGEKVEGRGLHVHGLTRGAEKTKNQLFIFLPKPVSVLKVQNLHLVLIFTTPVVSPHECFHPGRWFYQQQFHLLQPTWPTLALSFEHINFNKKGNKWETIRNKENLRNTDTFWGYWNDQ